MRTFFKSREAVVKLCFKELCGFCLEDISIISTDNRMMLFVLRHQYVPVVSLLRQLSSEHVQTGALKACFESLITSRALRIYSSLITLIIFHDMSL